MGILKQLKGFLLGIFLVAFITTGTYLASKSSLSIHHRKSSSNQSQTTVLDRESKQSPKIGVLSAPSNPLPEDEEVKASLKDSSESKHDDSSVNATVTSIVTTSAPALNTSSNVDSNDTTISTPTLLSTQTTSSTMAKSTSTQATASGPSTPSSPEISVSSTTSPEVIVSSSTTAIEEIVTSTAVSDKDQQSSQTIPTVALRNSSLANETRDEQTPAKGRLTPTLAAIVGLGCGLVFFVMIYAVFRLVKNFKTFRFRRLHEMPMDDFDDYSGVYVEHTVPIRG